MVHDSSKQFSRDNYWWLALITGVLFGSQVSLLLLAFSRPKSLKSPSAARSSSA
jgi:hypothetical protein